MTQGTPELPEFAAFLGAELDYLNAEKNRVIADVARVKKTVAEMQKTSASPAFFPDIRAPAIEPLDLANGDHLVT
jgi:hypothetical protein